jgi:exodeoxyribonuclease VII large subunit
MMERKLERYRFSVNQYGLKLKYFDPKRSIREKRQRLHDLEEKLKSLLLKQIEAERRQLDESAVKMSQLMEKQTLRDRHRLELLAGRLHACSPLAKIGGGYGFITDSGNHRIDSVMQVKAGDALRLKLRDGNIHTLVSEVEPLTVSEAEK